MSLWTPGGEHPIDDSRGAGQAGPSPAGDPAGMPSFDDLSPEDQEQAREIAAQMAETQQRLAGVPAADVVANHVMGLYELGAIHLSQETPNFDEAQLAIDAMAAIVDGIPGRMGEAEPTLRDALAQIRMVFVQLKTQVDDAAAGADD